MKIRVRVYEEPGDLYDPDTYIHSYVMDHNSADQRRVLAQQCWNAFEAGQVIVTYPEKD